MSFTRFESSIWRESERFAYSQNFAHDIGGGAADTLAKIIKCFQVRLVQGVSNDFDVHFIQVLLRNAIDKERSQWRIDQHGIVQLGRIGSHMDGFHLLKTTQRMAFRDQFRNRTLMQRASDQQNDIVNHVTVRDEIQERGQRLDGMVTQMLEFNNQLLAQFIINHWHRQWRRFVGQKLTIIRSLQMQFQICNEEKKKYTKSI